MAAHLRHWRILIQNTEINTLSIGIMEIRDNLLCLRHMSRKEQVTDNNTLFYEKWSAFFLRAFLFSGRMIRTWISGTDCRLSSPPRLLRIKSRFTGLPHHLGDGSFCNIRIIRRMGIRAGRLGQHVFEIRQIHIHQSFQHLQGRYLLISAGIIDHRNFQSAFLCDRER